MKTFMLLASRNTQDKSNFNHLIIFLFSMAETTHQPPTPYRTTSGPSNAAFDGPSLFST